MAFEADPLTPVIAMERLSTARPLSEQISRRFVRRHDGFYITVP